MSPSEIRVLILGVCSMLVFGCVWLYWARMIEAARHAPQDSRLSALDAAVKRTVRLITGVVVVMFGVNLLFDLADPEVIGDRVPCSVIFMVFGILLFYVVMRAIFTWLRDDLLSRWAEEDRSRTQAAR